MKYFLNDKAKLCYDRSYFQDYMLKNDLKELAVFKAIKVNTVYIFCRKFSNTLKKGRCLPAFCEGYSAWNGRLARCKFLEEIYDKGEKKVLKLKK